MANSADFASFVNKERERKKNQDLAQQLLGSRGRKSGAGSISSSRTESQKPTLLSRMSGVQKPRSSSAKPAANIDGKWQHDLHKLNNPNGPPKRLNRTVSASQIDRNSRTFNKFASVLDQNAQNARSNNEGPGFNIRGVAQGGPVTIVASNFAPGTTAADIEAVVAPHGGDTIRCKVITAKPTVMAEIVFATKEGADNVIAVFNGKKADGQTLYVYHKGNPGTGALHTRPMSLSAQSFDDMDIDTNGGARTGGYRDGLNQSARRSPPRGPRGRRRF